MNIAFDVGAYDGADTARYLKRGDRTICIEADPTLAERIRARFAAEIAAGQCVVLNIGVGASTGVLPFYLSRNPIWNSFDKAMAARAGEVKEILVPVRRLSDVIREYGRGYFVKIDVEGMDFVVLEDLATLEPALLPDFISCEASAKDGAGMLVTLLRMGFTGFNLVRQDSFDTARLPLPGSLAYVKWAARQWLRLQLRRHPGLLRALGSLKPSKEGSLKDASGEVAYAIDSAGPAPMEHRGDWFSPVDFAWLWKNIVDSGMIESVWWDIHARR